MAYDYNGEEPTYFDVDFGLIQKAVQTGHQIGADHEVWEQLAFNKQFFQEVRELAQKYSWPEPEEMLERLKQLNEKGDLRLEERLNKLGEAPEQLHNPTKVIIPSISFGNPREDLLFMRNFLEASDVSFSFNLKEEIVEKAEYFEGVAPTFSVRWVVLDLLSMTNKPLPHTRWKVSPDQLPVTEPAIVFALAPEVFTRFRDQSGVWHLDCAGLSIGYQDNRDVPGFCWPPSQHEPFLTLDVQDGVPHPGNSVPLCQMRYEYLAT